MGKGRIALFFDMDGVIVDSMPYHFISWYEALRPLGIRVSCFFVYQKEGERWEKTVRELLAQNRRRLSPRMIEGVFAKKKRIFRRYFRRFIFDGIEELLAGLKKEGIRLGLVTSTPLGEVRLMLPPRVLARFDVLISGEAVSRGKPDPDPYLKASAALGIPPEGCFVVENAPLGIRSAKAAGMFCCAMTTGLPPEYLSGSDVTVDTLPELKKEINSFIVKRRRQ